jgi:type IV pilus assembly protein PilC
MLFTYSALNKDGKTVKEDIEAVSYHEAINVLHQRGLIPVEIKEKRQQLSSSVLAKFSSVSLQDKILFVKNLSILVRAGVPLTKAIRILAEQTKSPKFKNILQSIHKQVESGKSLSEAFGQYPGTFKNIFISMFKVGELSGSLDKSLEYLAYQLDREHNLKSKTRGAMIYPAVVVFAIVLVGILMSIFVLPSLVSIFKDSGMQLPLMTRIVIGFVDFMSNHTVLALGGFIGITVGTVALYRTATGRRIFDTAILGMFVIGAIVQKINLARFSRTMSSMLKSGTPIIEALQVTADAMDNVRYREALQKAVQDIKVGKTLTASLSQHPRLFNYLVVQMIGVGEESGNVDSILEELAGHYEAEVDDTMRNFSSVIEPLMILFIGAIVGILAVALISPIYSLTQGDSIG